MSGTGPSSPHGGPRQFAPGLDELVQLAVRGLSRIGGQAPASVAFTYRGQASPSGPVVRQQGSSLRYAAIAALGLGRVPEELQRQALGGRSAAEFAVQCQAAALTQAEPGATALSLWAAAEVAGSADSELVTALEGALDRDQLDTVIAAWMVTAAVAVGPDAAALQERAAERLLAHTGTVGVFAHTLPPARGLRGHVGCFADQVYPIQALARLAAATGEARFLVPANRTAERIVRLQGAEGQWWWHYDHRDGSVVEGFPVYSVHQHGMAPMALADLAAAGGDDHSAAVAGGVRWLTAHPECVEPLIAPELDVVWRKVGRREPRKASRALAAATTALRPGLHLPFVDRVVPPGKVDYECRPYELGWLLYAWAGDGGPS